MNRKKRSDRMHIIYGLLNKETGDMYIGLTVGTSETDLLRRVKQHVYRCYIQESPLPLYQNMRASGIDSFDYTLITKVRGKKEAHRLETLLVDMFQPELNLA